MSDSNYETRREESYSSRNRPDIYRGYSERPRVSSSASEGGLCLMLGLIGAFGTALVGTAAAIYSDNGGVMCSTIGIAGLCICAGVVGELTRK